MSVALSASNLGAGGIEAGRRAEHDGTAINHGEAGASYISSMALRSTPSTSAITPPRISAEAHEMRELGLRHETAVQGIAGPSRTASHQTDTSRSGSIRSAQRGIINEDAVHPSESRLAGEAGADTGANPGVGPDANEGENGTDAARMVRRNLLRACWSGFVDLGKGRKIVLMLRLAIALAQICAYIPIISLPPSHRISYSSGNDRCDPKGLFVFLLLHSIRVLFSIPADLYLGLSPHRSPRARRSSAEARAARERARSVGNLALDRRVGRLADWLGVVHCILFIAGNYIVYSSTACRKAPASSIPLFWASWSVLAISYAIILEVALLVLAVVFLLPTVILVLRAMGLLHRLPQAEIHPETGKMEQKDVDRFLKLVYFTPADEEEDDPEMSSVTNVDREQQQKRSSLHELRTLGQGGRERSDDSASPHTTEATSIPLPLSRPASPQTPKRSLSSHTTPTLHRTQTASSHHGPVATSSSSAFIRPGIRQISRLFFPRRSSPSRQSQDRNRAQSGTESQAHASSNPNTTNGGADATRRPTPLKYPLHPLHAHRATCPICLIDFQEPGLRGENPGGESAEADAEAERAEEGEWEPLRLMRCGHVFHRSCVDQWLTSVSARCPVCQKPVEPFSSPVTSASANPTANANANENANEAEGVRA